jgi:hypothetical protein
LAIQTDTDITDWDLSNIFRANPMDRPIKLLTDHNRINQRFFNNRNHPIILARDLGRSAIDTDMVRDLNDTYQRKSEENKRKIERQLNDARVNVESYHYQWLSEFRKLRELDRKIKSFEAGDDRTLLKQLYQVQDGNRFKFIKSVGHLLVFESVNDIVCVNDHDASDTCNFGTAKVTLNLERFDLGLTWKNPKMSYRHVQHPHVKNNTRICWGNSLASEISRAKSDLCIVSMLNIFFRLLGSYNPDDPYTHLKYFQRNQRGCTVTYPVYIGPKVVRVYLDKDNKPFRDDDVPYVYGDADSLAEVPENLHKHFIGGKKDANKSS